MSEKKVEKVTDKFVLMATSGKKMDGEVKNLPQIPPINYEFKALPEYDCVVNKAPEFDEEKAYANFLKEKEELKAHYRPFFKKYSKTVETPVTRTRLVDFTYRKEDKLDKKDFSRVLNGEGEFENVKLPHYVGPEYRWNAFYRKELVFDKIDENKFYLIEFEAVDYIGEVYLNGRLVGRHTGFFAPFTVDITDQVKEGVNVLVVAVKNDIITMGTDVNGHRSFGDKIYAATSLGYDEPYEGWHHCPAGAGIIGDVNLIVTGRQRVVDIFVRPDIDNSKATIYTTVFNYPLDCEKVKLYYRVEGRNFEELVIDGEEEISNKLAVNTNYFVHEVKIPNFKMWQPKLPYLYDVTVKVTTLDGAVLDEYQTHFGMRKFHMDENSTPKGKFYLNNERIVLRGANEMGHLPRCVMEGNDEQLFEDIMIVKVANMNYFRMTQRPVFKKIYDFFDMTGMMCQTDFPLFSYLKSSALGDAIKQVDEMERLVRNHPCCVV
ncbi:MAG: glycoside hydrolase family 2, partial [Clostridia bacterium]|nr:glycoside hydrolase family 2 [Clostridia bacterium]